MRNYFSLYFIPVIPLEVADRYVECSSCGSLYSEEILSYDPEKEREETHLQFLRVMVMAALADGEIDDAERAEIQRQYTELAGLPIPPERFESEIAMAMSSGADLNSYVAILAPDLSPHGKALVVKLAFHTMSATGTLQPGHQAQLAKLAKTLQIPEDQYRTLIATISELPNESE